MTRRRQAQGVQVYSRPLRYRRRSAPDELGRPRVTVFGEEKGSDVWISPDVIQMPSAYPAPSGATERDGHGTGSTARAIAATGPRASSRLSASSRFARLESTALPRYTQGSPGSLRGGTVGIRTVDEELLRQLEIMAPDQKRQVLDFALALGSRRPKGTPSS